MESWRTMTSALLIACRVWSNTHYQMRTNGINIEVIMKEIAIFFIVTAFVGGLPATILFYMAFWFFWAKKKMTLSLTNHAAAFLIAALMSAVARLILFATYKTPILSSGPEMSQQAFHLLAPALSVIAVLKISGKIKEQR
jgi:hypothetical protein